MSVLSPILSAFLQQLALAPRQTHKALTLWPLVVPPDSRAPLGPPYVALADAIESGALRVDEVDAGGRVPHVRVHNQGDVAVLVLFGEELRGAKQDRVANASFLVPAQSELVIDVSCVEQGRWSRRRGAGFAAGLGVVSHAIRRRMAARVAAARALGERFHADQAEVWGDVRERLEWAGATSSTGAYADYLSTRESDLGEITKVFHPVERQAGFVAALGDEVVGLEAVGRPEVFARVFPRLLRSYAIDAADAAQVRAGRGQAAQGGAPVFDAPEDFLGALAAAPATSGASLGLGRDLRIHAERVEGCALEAEAIVHLTAFPALVQETPHEARSPGGGGVIG
jgi:hypothetical protein